jgi:hypothetical protein
LKYGAIATWLANAALKRSFAGICAELLDNWEAVIMAQMETAVPA